ncbi:hypothetical protein F5Y08DRAFT_271428 [Xylaria arbuscula]|nr:hypothetical protein F5Y08DRAFT_271428 [Xylaria arbuscula]
MAHPELRRPPTRTGSGSRPPTSRFQEGSMNDRTSAAPPAQFLGPEQLKELEDRFSTEPPTPREARRARPFSAAAVYQHASIDEPQEQEQEYHQQQQKQRPAITHKKSSSFFGRVRDALFHRGGGGQHGHGSKQQEVRRKHSSLQEPLQQPLPPPPPRPDYLHADRSQSEVNIAQMFPNPRDAADRPSREDVMASYNQLVASGFFQNHAIQSTRHAAPTAAAAGRQTFTLPNDLKTAPRPPVRIPSISTTTRSGSVSPMPIPMPSPNPQGRTSREYVAATMAAPAAPRGSLSSLFRPSIPDLHTKDSWLTLRGRKRTRGDGDETPTPDAHPSSTTANSAGYFSQPLKRVAKKLREMPSSSSQLNRQTNIKNATPATQHSSHQAAPDGVVRLVPSVSSGGSLHPNERPIRLRSPSPATADTIMSDDNERSERTTGHDRAGSGMRRPRKTFSYNLRETSHSRSRTVDRERERGRERDNYRVQRRSSSTARPDSRTRASRNNTPQPPQNPLGQWQGVSLEDTVIHRDSIDSARSSGLREREWERAEERTQYAKTRQTMHSPLQTMTDANGRSVPSVAKAPERWHGTGKAYHLKDRGSRPDLARGRPEEKSYEKENDAAVELRRRVDRGVDIDVHERRGRHSREAHYRQQELAQWHIGSAL